MKSFAVAAVVFVALAGFVVAAAVHRGGGTPDRRVKATVAERTAEPAPEMAPAVHAAAAPEEPAAVAPPAQDPVEKAPPSAPSKARELLDSIDWKRVGRSWLAMQKGNFAEWDYGATGDFAKLGQVWKEVGDDPSLQAEIGRDISVLWTAAYLAAMGIELSPEQREAIAKAYESPEMAKAFDFDWQEENARPLQAVRGTVQQSLRLDEVVRQVLLPEQMGTYQGQASQDPLWSYYQKEISAPTPVAAVQKLANVWMSRYDLPEEHRASALAAAQTYYDGYRKLSAGFENADLAGRAQLWLQIIDAQEQVQKQLEALTPDHKPDVMSLDSYQVVTFRP